MSLTSEFLLKLPKLLLDVVIAVLRLSKEDPTRQHLNEMLTEIADCVSAIAEDVQNGERSTERCAEL